MSAKYFKAAGYASGKYEGTEKILMVGSNAGVAAKTAEVVKQNLENDGLPGHDAPGRAADDVHALLQRAQGQGRDVPERRLDPRLRGRPDDALADVRRQEHPARRATRTGPQLDDPKINDAIDAAEIAPVEQRAQLWGDIDKMVTATAAAIPWIWDKQALVQSKNVDGVIAENNSQWDLTWTSIK